LRARACARTTANASGNSNTFSAIEPPQPKRAWRLAMPSSKMLLVARRDTIRG
jgi:hypothetical protein